MKTNEEYIQRTLELARMGLGTTWPNPLVGAVIVKNGRVISEGYHKKKGQDHAEAAALKNAQESVEGATIYVNLEPCCHLNKSTPPCAQALIQAGIKKVVICNLDPNPQVNGQGVELLRSHGIEVEHGILKEEGEKLNEVFFLSQRLQRPFIHFKGATTLDGKIAMSNGESQWITGARAREDVHRMRSEHQAILIGGETLRRDNPRLTVRLKGYSGAQPQRIVLTKSGKLPQDSHLFTDEFKDQTHVYHTEDLKCVMDDLFKKNIISVMLETGPGLTSEFMKRGLIDRISLYQNPSFLGEGLSLFQGLNVRELNQRPRLTSVESRWIDGDHFLTGRLVCSQD